jgi:predicted ATPase/class 3 adenylate cyclase
MRADLPTGTVTFLFTDVEGSTLLLSELGDEAYANALAEHRRIVEEACAADDGIVVDTEGDAFFVAFQSAPHAMNAARTIHQAHANGSMKVRIGVHTGTPIVTEAGYVGIDVHRAARIAGAAHGGQTVLSSTARALVEGSAGVTLRDVGEHRLKDLSAAERLYQLGDEHFPPLKSLGQSNLPVPSTPFLGRAHELAEVVGLLRREDVRLLTLTGPAGTGKTRLALQAAAEVSEAFSDGLWWVSLAALRDAALVLPSIAQTLGVMEEQGRALVDTLGSRLDGKRLLLVLDNAEHLLPDVAAEFVALIAGCPMLKLLVTSRERIQVSAETIWLVPPLNTSDAEQMFRERARSVGVTLSSDERIAELCARLDELPLAIELAAARTVLFSPAQLLERLTQRLDLLKGGRDAAPRQQTLRAAIDWSFELLAAEEQRVFCALSVFAGGCTFEAAEAVVDTDPDTLQSLLDKSLLRRRDTELEPRYWMLETIRSYAAEKLDLRGDAYDYHRRHAEWIRGLALERIGKPGPNVERAASPTELGSFRPEYDNARSALAWCWIAGEDDLALGLGAACCRFWLGEGLFRDATTWLGEAAPRMDTASAETRLQALEVAGLISFFVTDEADQAEAFWSDARSIADELRLADDSAWLDHRLAGIPWTRGDIETAIASHTRLLSHYRRTGDRFAQAGSLHNLGEVLRDVGRFEESRECLLEAEALYVELDSSSGLANNTHSLGDLALDRGDFDAAVGLYRRAMETSSTDRARLLAYCLAGIASALAERGRDEEAARLWGAVCAAEQSSGFRMLTAERGRYEAHLDRLERSAAWNHGLKLSLEEAAATRREGGAEAPPSP